MDQNLEKFMALLEDTEKAKEVLTPSVEETQKNLEGIGIYLTIEQLNEIAQGARDSESGAAELDEAALEQVSGGAKKSQYYNAGKAAGKVLRQVFNIGLGFVGSLW